MSPFESIAVNSVGVELNTLNLTTTKPGKGESIAEIF